MGVAATVSPHRRARDLARERERQRDRRAWPERARTEHTARIPKYRLKLLAQEAPPVEGARRPATRAECVNGVRPCPFVGCAANLYLDVNLRTHNLKLNFPWLEPDEMTDSCALDIADQGPTTLETVGRLMNMTRERVRQIENTALRKILRSTHPAVVALLEAAR